MFKILIFLLCVICVADSYKILLFFPYTIRSLTLLGDGFAKHLLNAGHEVTFITGFPKNKPIKNFREIDISELIELFINESSFTISSVIQNPQDTNNYNHLHEFALQMTKKALNIPSVQKLLSDPNEKFDVIIADLYEIELSAGLSVLYECPMIWSYSMGPHWQVLRLIDESTNPAYTSDYLSSNLYPISFPQRAQELWTQLQRSFQKDFITTAEDEVVYKEIFGPLIEKRGRKLPSYQDVIFNASMILGNDHNALGNTPRTPQNFKLIGGYHIETPTKPLPKELQELMDNAKHGVIYFSMGSMFKSKDMPQSLIDGLVKMFGELKQTVIWKFEADIKKIPKNLHIVKWAPQPSILAHPNCLFFITHGGHLSSTESIFYGTPTIGVPIFLDQFVNMQKAVAAGYALKVDLNLDLPKNLKVAIDTMLRDQKYRQRVKELSTIFHDRLLSPGQELVHWVEHVVRTKGAPHLRSPALLTPWYQKMFLDLIAVILVSLAIIIIAIKRILNLCFGKRSDLSSKKKN